MPKTIGEPASNRIAPDAARAMRAAIAETGGREVFFAGSINGEGVVEHVRVCARGSESAVPALLENLQLRNVVIHNHPGGDLGPSEADLELSVIFAHHGHGVFIIDNAAERVYVVIEPFLDKDKHRLKPSELKRAFGPDSPLARHIPEFEARPQQLEMMEAVARAFNHDGIAVIEAPTGVGKTMAYLLPAVIWATRNRERVVISTKTINLQEQILYKDIPVLQKCFKKPFQATLVKGRRNYLCLRKLERALSEATLFEDEDRASIAAIAQWAEKTGDGTLSDLPFVPAPEVWDRCCSEADTCSIANCPDPGKCFLGKARREIAKADLLVVNHHMLFSDLAIKKEIGNFHALGVLPSFQRLILDEAHHIEDVATEYFGVEAARNGAVALIGRFIRAEARGERGLLPYIKVKLIHEAGRRGVDAIEPAMELIDKKLAPALAGAREALIAAFAALRSLVAERSGEIGRDIEWRLTRERLEDPALREIHGVYIMPAVEEVLAAADLCVHLFRILKEFPKTSEEDEPPFMTELIQLDAYQNRLRRLAAALPEASKHEWEENVVRWIEIDATDASIVRVAKAPLEVAEPLANWVYTNLKTVVMTSATLSVGQEFGYFFSRAGLNLLKDREPETISLESPFDYKNQAMLAIAQEIADPQERGFLEDTVDYVREILSITRGHALVLFTSFHALTHVYKSLEQELRAQGMTPLKQGAASRTRLLDQFRQDASSVLFATDSFWEGIDVAGDALQCVILPKLPFRVPTEPITEARTEAIQQRGGNPFLEYTVPQAVIKFRQGFGRLIRRKSDRGAVVVLDRRLLTKHYGKIFLRSLPGVRVVQGPRRGLVTALDGFFSNRKETDHE